MDTLWTESLWGDEGFSALAVQQPFLETMGIVMRDTAPPLFYVVGWIWGSAFGYSEVALRTLSLLLMLGASVFAGLIVNRVGRDWTVALGAGLLAFVSPFLFPFAFEFRMYALFAFTVVGSVYFFTSRQWKGYVVFTTAALYSHHYALFTVFGQLLWFLLAEFDWKHIRKFTRQLWPFLLVGALYLPWLYPFYLQLTRVKGAGFWLSVPTPGEVGNLLERFVTGGIAESKRATALLMVFVLLVGKRWREVGKKWVELTVIFLMPIILSYTISYIITPIFFDRYLLSVAIGMAVLIVVGVQRWAKPVVILLLLLYTFSSITLFTHPTKRPFRALSSYVRETQKEGDFLLNYNGKAHHLWESKYYGIAAPIYTPEGPLPLYVGTAQMKPEDTTAEIPETVSELLVITSDPVENVEIPLPWEPTEVAEFGELKVVRFEREEL